MAMKTIRVSQSVRPIRFAWLVTPPQPDTFDRAVELNTALWGGLHNPIVPIWRRFPSAHPASRSLGILREFDPDFIVNLTSLPVPKAIQDEYDPLIVEKDDILRAQGTVYQLERGLSMAAAMESMARSWAPDGASSPALSYVALSDRTPHRRFLAAQWGQFPTDLGVDFSDNYLRLLSPQNVPAHYLAHSDPAIGKSMSPIKLTTYALRSFRVFGTFSSHQILLGDPRSLLDVIEFWNLRASGRSVLFVPIGEESAFPEAVAAQTNDGSYPLNERVQNQTQILKAPSVEISDFNASSTQINALISESLTSVPFSANWGIERIPLLKDVDVVRTDASQTDDEVLLQDDELVPFKALRPPFLPRRGMAQYTGHVWANVLRLSSTHSNDVVTTYPTDAAIQHALARGLGVIGLDPLRTSSDGIVHYGSDVHDYIRLRPMAVSTFFNRYLDAYGLNAVRSPAGKAADGIIRFMGGRLEYDIRIFKLPAVRAVLKELAGRQDKTVHQPLSKSAIIGTMKREWNKEFDDLMYGQDLKIDHPQLAAFEYLSHKHVIKPGRLFKCETCDMTSWYSLNDFGDQFSCRYCRATQDVTGLENKNWYYQPNGLFAIQDSGHGSIGVLVTLWRLGNFSNGAKYITSTKLVDKATAREYEIDFALMGDEGFREMPSLVLGEARDQKDFTRKETNKLAKLAKRFSKQPYLCFTTLKDDFSRSEKVLFRGLYNQGHRLLLFTPAELNPYDLHERFEHAPHRYPVTLDQLSENTLQTHLGITTQ